MNNAKKPLGYIFYALLRRDITIAFRHPEELLHPVIFFVISVSLFPLAISPSPGFLQQIAPGIIWISALLSTLLALDGLFRSDYEDGSLEQLLVSPHPITIFVLAKIIVHWITSGLPLILISPLLALMLYLPSESYLILIATLVLGTPTMSFISGIGIALTMGVKQSSILLILLVTPLFIPILIFATSAVQSAALHIDTSGQLYLLAALFILSLSFAPIVISTVLKVSLN